jgi:ABC-2 type transport system permease protein
MPVFKAYLLVIKKNIPSLMIYFFIFVTMAVIFLKFVGTPTYADFTAVKSNLILISGENTRLVDGFTEYLAENANFISPGDDEQSIQDALFFGKADYVLRIPAGFTDSFMSGRGDVMLEKTTRDLSGSVNIDLHIEKYLSLAQLYVRNVPGISQESLVASVRGDLGEASAVDMKANVQQAETNKLSETFRYLASPILGILLVGITAVMLAFTETEVSRRNSCAPLSSVRTSLQLFLGNAIFTAVVWFLLIVISLGLGDGFSLTPGNRLLCLNAFVFSIMALSLGFLVGQFIRSYIAQSAVTNVVSLGASFISGVFIPQYVLGPTVLKVSSFLPFYWYVKAVDTIGAMPSYSFEDVRPVLGHMLIQLGFAAAFVIIALVAARQKKLKRAS